jgi:hypothetical protein
MVDKRAEPRLARLERFGASFHAAAQRAVPGHEKEAQQHDRAKDERDDAQVAAYVELARLHSTQRFRPIHPFDFDRDAGLALPKTPLVHEAPLQPPIRAPQR